MNKSEIRKKILKIRKQENFKNISFNFKNILRFLKKKRIQEKVIYDWLPIECHSGICLESCCKVG